MSLTISAAQIVGQSESPLLAAPDSWPRRPLGDVATILNGFAFKSKEFVYGDGKPLIRIRDIFNDHTTAGFVGEYDHRYLVRPGDLLVGMDGDFNCARWRGPEGLLNQRVCKITPKPDYLDLDFLMFLLPGYLKAIHDATSSTTVTHLSSRDVAQIPIPVPTLAEQKVLAELFSMAATNQQSARSHLRTAQRTIQQLHQAILTTACSGTLTADWRDEHPANAAENSLRDIVAKRQQFLKTGKQPRVSLAGARFDVPQGWTISSLDAVSTRITSGSRDWSPFYGRGTGTFVMAQNVRRGYLDWSFRQAVDPPVGDKSSERSQIEVGDLLVTIVGANTGDVGPVTETRHEHYVCQSVALVRPADTNLAPFLNLWFNSPMHGRQYLDECIYGAGRPHLSFDQLKNAPVAIPSFAEQAEIVHRASQLLASADIMLARIGDASKAVEHTSQAILAKVLRGGLYVHGGAEDAA